MPHWVIVPAAGIGARMGSAIPKQYMTLGSRTVLEQTLHRLARLPGLAGMVVALHPQDEYWPRVQLPMAVPVMVCDGGSQRSQSVSNALQTLHGHAQEDDWVLVHDAVRPCVRIADIMALMDAIEGHAGGGLLAVPVSNTLKRSNDAGNVDATVSRTDIWQALTPQAFRLGQLRSALAAAERTGEPITDEASALELVGMAPRLVRGSADNIKITYPEDLVLAELILEAQRLEPLRTSD